MSGWLNNTRKTTKNTFHTTQKLFQSKNSNNTRITDHRSLNMSDDEEFSKFSEDAKDLFLVLASAQRSDQVVETHVRTFFENAGGDRKEVAVALLKVRFTRLSE